MHWFRVLLAFSILSSLACSAQQNSSPSPRSGFVTPAFGQEGHNIAIEVAVTDKSGQPVHGLRQQDFTLLDNKRVMDLNSFSAVEPDAEYVQPVEMVLVVDAINGNVLQAGRQREAVRRFLQSNEGKLPMPVSIMTATDKGIAKRLPASSDGNALAAVLDQTATGLRVVNRSTNYSDFDRFRLSLKALDAAIAYETGKPGKKVIVWISPGWPTLAKAASDITSTNQRQLFNTIVNASTTLRVNRITLYQVVSRGVGIGNTDSAEFSFYTQYLHGVRSTSQAYPPNLALPVLAIQSGGLVLNGSNDLPQAMANEIAKVAADARVFYMLTFQPSQPDRADAYHALQVLINQPGLTARTRSGYYAQP